METINCDVQINSSAAGESGLCFGNIDNTTATTAGAALAGIDANGCLVTADAPVQSFDITDGTNTETVNSGDTVTYVAGDGLEVALSATDTVTYSACLSTDAGNELQFGTDGCLYHDETVTSMVQNDTTGVITFTDEDGGTSTADVVSTDAGNNITVGSDGGAYFDAPPVLTGGSWDDATNTLNLTLNTDGTNSNVAIPLTDLIGVWIADFTISDGTTTDLVNNHETVTFVGGDGITTTVTNNQVEFDVCVSTDANNALSIGTDGCVYAPTSAFDITDGTITETVNNGDTVTFVGGECTTVTVSGTDTVTIDHDVYQAPVVLTANAPTTVNHALGVDYPQFVAYDQTTGEMVKLCVTYVDANNIQIESTVAGTYEVRVSC